MLIEVQGLSKRYRPRGPMVVEEVSFTIDRGETLAIFGDSGSGKSTIGQILAPPERCGWTGRGCPIPYGGPPEGGFKSCFSIRRWRSIPSCG